MSDPEVVVAIPWRPKKVRIPAYEMVKGWYRAHLPGARLIDVDTDHEVFNLGACRNAAVREATRMGADAVVITDADTLPPPTGLRESIEQVVDDHYLHLPFDQCLYAGHDGRGGLANGGVHVVTPKGWDAIGGQDERMLGWGGDDDQLVAAATCLSGVVRHAGTAVSLWHADEARVCNQDNRDLVNRYWSAVNNPDAMRRLVAER